MKRVIVIAGATLTFAGVAAAGWSYGGCWGSFGSGDGQFNEPKGIAVAPDYAVYVADSRNHRVQYFTPMGSFLGKWGSYGTGPGEFSYPVGIAVAPNGYVYVTEEGNYRVQYFRWSEPAVSPTSLGRVKALFR